MKKILERMAAIQERKKEIRTQLEGGENLDLDAIQTELDTLDSELSGLESRKKMLEGIAAGSVGTPVPGADQGTDESEKRAKEFKNNRGGILDTDTVKRSLTLASGGIATPTRVSGINEGENTVSGLLGMVKVVNAKGMGTDSVVYQTGEMTANIGADGTAPTASDATFAIAEIKPILINTVSYVSKHIEKLSPLDYRTQVVDSALKALRTKVGQQIAVGNPNAAKAEICGIIYAGAIDDSRDLEITEIDATTLRKIALNFGGDENLEGDCILLLNKKDLIAFGDIRGTNEKKAVYEISFDTGSTTVGTIKDGGLAVRFCINSALTATADAAAGKYSMLYGKAPTYQLDLFGDYTVEVSRDEKFSLGQLSVLGEVMVGGNVTSHNGWMRCKKKAAQEASGT